MIRRPRAPRAVAAVLLACAVAACSGGTRGRRDGGGGDGAGGDGGADADGGGPPDAIDDRGGADADASDVPTDDGGAACPTSPCDPVMQCGCGDGEGCYLDADGPVCAAAGSARRGEPCDAANACEPGHVCLEGDDGCAKLCDRNADCPGGGLCSGVITGAVCRPGAEEPDCHVCNYPTGCNVLDQDCPGAGEGCYIVAADGTSDCADAGDGGTGAACRFVNECAAGLICTGDDECRPLCNAEGGAPTCPDGTGECHPLAGDIRTPDGRAVGVCAP